MRITPRKKVNKPEARIKRTTATIIRDGKSESVLAYYVEVRGGYLSTTGKCTKQHIYAAFYPGRNGYVDAQALAIKSGYGIVQ